MPCPTITNAAAVYIYSIKSDCTRWCVQITKTSVWPVAATVFSTLSSISSLGHSYLPQKKKTAKQRYRKMMYSGANVSRLFESTISIAF